MRKSKYNHPPPTMETIFFGVSNECFMIKTSFQGSIPIANIDRCRKVAAAAAVTKTVKTCRPSWLLPAKFTMKFALCCSRHLKVSSTPWSIFRIYWERMRNLKSIWQLVPSGWTKSRMQPRWVVDIQRWRLTQSDDDWLQNKGGLCQWKRVSGCHGNEG